MEQASFDDLQKAVLTLLPLASFDTDNDEQIIIYTGLKENIDGSLVAMEEN